MPKITSHTKTTMISKITKEVHIPTYSYSLQSRCVRLHDPLHEIKRLQLQEPYLHVLTTLLCNIGFSEHFCYDVYSLKTNCYSNNSVLSGSKPITPARGSTRG